MKSSSRHPIMDPRGGVTLAETVISLVVLVAVMGTMLGLVEPTADTTRVTIALDTLEKRGNRALNTIAKVLYQAGRATVTPALAPPFGGSSLRARFATDYVGGNLVYGPEFSIEYRQSPDDPLDGIDNDENGLVDDGMVVIVEDMGLPTEQTHVILIHVAPYLEGEQPDGLDNNGNGLIDERGLAFDMSQNTLKTRITVQGRSREGRLLTRTVESAVTFRN